MSKHDYGGKGAVDFAKTWWLGILLEDRHHPPLSRYQRDTNRTSKLNRNRKAHQEGTQYGANEPQRPFYHLNLYRRKLDCLTYERPYTGHLKLVVKPYQRDTDRTSKLNRNRKPHQEGTQYGANEPQRPFFHLNLYRRKLDCLTYERPYTRHLKLVVNTQSEKNCVFNKHDFLIVKCFVT